MPSTTLYEEVSLCGLWLELEAECDLHYCDDSFSHEFGTEICGHWEIERIYTASATYPILPQVRAQLAAVGVRRNRRFTKRARQWARKVERQLVAADPEELFSERAKDAAVERGADEAAAQAEDAITDHLIDMAEDRRLGLIGSEQLD